MTVVHDLDRPHPGGGPRCSTGSALRGESLAATASLGRRWLLIEIAGAWGWSAFFDSSAIDPGLARRIVQRVEGEGMRIAAIRRPGRARGSGRWRWAIVDTSPGGCSVHRGECSSAEDFLRLPLDGSTATGWEGIADDGPILAVCAHGRHDECCAVRGRRVASELAEWFPDETWECSHIGGDRFAATMLIFPHGLNYGRVDHLDAPAIVSRYLEGRIAHDGFRGRTSFDRTVQAAQHAARTQLGDDRIDAYPPIASVPTDDGWRVELAAGTATVVVDVAETATSPLFTTCGATTAVPIRQYAATRLEVRRR